MIKNTVVAVAVSALACTAWASSASAKHHAKHTPAPAAAQTAPAIPGVNPMTNAPATPAVKNAQPFTKQPGVNPM